MLPPKNYVADLDVPGAWFGGTVRSSHARGVLHGFEFDKGFDSTRVCVVTPRDIPGTNVVALIAEDQPLLCERDIEHHGEPLLLVAAPDRATLAEALAALRAHVEPRSPLFEMERSKTAFHEVAIDKGDVDAAFAQATHVVTGEYHTGSQSQVYLETQGCIAWPADPDGVVLVKGSLQCPHYVQKALAKALGVPLEKCRVVQADTGGGFGGKEDYPSVVACHAALLARKCGRPVAMIYDRHEDLAVTPKRHPARVRHRTALDAEGNLLAMDIDVRMDGGAYTTLSPVVLSRGCIHAAGAYRCPNVRIRGTVVKTNHVPYGAFRGFGAPQTIFAIERQMDRIARTLQVHPAALRRRNALRLTDTTATGQVLRWSVGAQKVLDDALARSGFAQHAWAKPRPEPAGRVRTGLGMAFFFHGAGFTGAGETMLASTVEVELTDAGTALVRSGATDIGQGTHDLFARIAADAFGTGVSDVAVAVPDTAEVPNSGPTVASRTCMIVGSLVDRACRELAERLARAPGEGFRAAVLRHLARGASPRAIATYRPPAELAWDEAHYRGDAYAVYGYAVDVARVRVDLDTFAVEVEDLWTTVDVGKAISPVQVRGQIEGGTLQALGWSQIEVLTTKDGRFRQDRLATSIVPTALDAPRFHTSLVEEPYPFGPQGAKGVGELPMDGGAPAVLSAIEDALGIHLTDVPATPESILRAWLAEHPSEALPR